MENKDEMSDYADLHGKTVSVYVASNLGKYMERINSDYRTVDPGDVLSIHGELMRESGRSITLINALYGFDPARNRRLICVNKDRIISIDTLLKSI